MARFWESALRWHGGFGLTVIALALGLVGGARAEVEQRATADPMAEAESTDPGTKRGAPDAADQDHGRHDDRGGVPSGADDGRPGQRLPTWQMPAVIVEATRLPELREEERIGSHVQPRWTAHRRFPTTRVYVVPEGEIEVEYWLRVKTPRHGDTEFEHREELEIGLPWRFQLDLYLIERDTKSESTKFDQAVELRWALADWGKIPGNPALYAEFINQEDDPTKVELKVLLGGEIAPRWHWGVNPVWERETSGERTNEFEMTTGLSYAVVDERVSVGMEGKFAVENTKEDRGSWGENLRLGPSIQVRPIPAIHVDVAPLFGLTSDSSESDVFIVIGWEF